MILDQTVELGTNRGSKNSIGATPTAAFSRTKYLAANVQPLSGEIALKEYGLDASTEPMIAFIETDASVVEGLQIRINSSIIYTIHAVSAWARHYELILKKVL